MDRREFLKRVIAASALGVGALIIDEYKALTSRARNTIKPTKTVKGLPKIGSGNLTSNGMIFGGNLFNAYSHGRDLLDVADVRIERTLVLQKRF
jgi:hypothetical protein